MLHNVKIALKLQRELSMDDNEVNGNCFYVVRFTYTHDFLTSSGVFLFVS